jgi:hypothetical protein
MAMEVRPVTPVDIAYVRQSLTAAFHGTVVAVHDELIDAAALPAAIAWDGAEPAATAGATRLWLVTTNDNVRALRFYQRNGFDLVAVHRDAVTRARALKPAIPRVLDGIPVRHELELEVRL